MKILITLLLTLTMLFQPPPCATVDLTLGSASLQQGQTQSIQSIVTNCGTTKIKLGIVVTVTDAVGNFVIIRNTIQNYNPGQSVTFDNSYVVGASAPLGTYRVISIVFDNSPQGNSTELARDTVEFQVTAAE
jgi:hypothetical protein